MAGINHHNTTNLVAGHAGDGRSLPCRTMLRRRLWVMLIGKVTLMACVLGLFFKTHHCVADEPQISEYQIKAAFLVNFPKYVEWPEGTFANSNTPIIIAVLGESSLVEELEKMTGNRKINGHEVILKKTSPNAELPDNCHILFVPASEQQHRPDILSHLTRTGVLTVGESDDFFQNGGMINLSREDKKVSLEVNLTATGKAGLKISSKLLSVAKVVKGRQD